MQQTLLANNQIRSKYVIFIDDDGNNSGKIHIKDAQNKANLAGLDLVQVGFSKEKDIPVCKAIDYGKMKYDQSKRKGDRKKTHDLKEIMFRLRISDHDLDIKKRKVEQLISKSHKVKFGVELRGRERAFRSNARKMLEDNLEHFSSIARHDSIRETDKSVFVTLDPL